MIFERFCGSILNSAKTQIEISRARDLITRNAGNVLLMAYKKGDDQLQGELFGPRGYEESEMDVIKRKLKESDKINISGNKTGGVVTIINRKRNNL